MRLIKKTLLLCLTGCLVLGNADELNITPPRSAGVLTYFYNGKSLREALTMFASNNGLHIQFAPDLGYDKLRKSVNGRFEVADNTQLLNLLSSQYGFEWFIFSGTLYITPRNRISKSIEVAPDDMSMVKVNLEQLGLLNSKFGYSELIPENKITISGPSTYVDLLIYQIRSLHIAPSSQQFAVYRLKYANATDTQLNFNGQQITIPGVATILQSLLQGGQNVNSIGNNHLVNQVTEPVQNQINSVLSKRDTSGDSNSGAQAATANAIGSITSPLIQADSRTNTIVMRDKKNNLAIYKNLIELLDVPTPLIQVEVLIVHLDQKKLEQAGVNWWASDKGYSGGFGVSNLLQPTNNLALSYGQINPGQLVVTNMASFASSLQFLEQNNIAQTVGKPSLATTDNLPAIVGVNENLYYGSQTQNATNANPNNNNTYMAAQIVQALQITPHVIFSADNSRQIKLSVVLQDGAVNTQNNSVTPNTVQSNITSQAVINEGQSLLLAGYTRNEIMEVETKLPILGDIPILGWFFKNKSNQNHSISTLYLVTPHIIWQNDMYKLKDYVMVSGNKFDIRQNYQLLPVESHPVGTTKVVPPLIAPAPTPTPLAKESSAETMDTLINKLNNTESK